MLSRGSLALLFAFVVACQDDEASESVAALPAIETAEAKTPDPIQEERGAIPSAPDPAEATTTAATKSKLHYADVKITSSLEGDLVRAVGKHIGQPLTQVVKRSLVWFLSPAKEIWKGDRLQVVFEVPEDAEPIVHAFWYASKKLGETVEGVRFQADGEKYARYYRENGEEIEQRLIHSPIKEYEQITSLLKDGRGHRGVDFKAPEGTPIYAPFDGRIARKNWSTHANGLCLDIKHSRSKTRAFLLHLQSIPKGLRAGSRVKRGQLVGYSGDTGRSTAPHLHYQLQNGKRGKIIDPFDFHRTERARLPDSKVAKLRSLFEEYGRFRTGPS